MEQDNYRIDFEIKGEPLCIPFGSYNDYTLIPKKELEDFVIYMIEKCIRVKAFMTDDEKFLLIKNIHLYKKGKQYAICSIENSGIQIYP